MLSKNQASNFIYLLLIGSFVTLPLKISYNNIFIISAFISSILYALYYRPKLDWKNPGFWFFALFFSWYALSACFSHNQSEAWTRVEVRLMYLIIPFPWLLMHSTKGDKDKMLRYFSWAISFFTLVLLFNNLYQYISNGNCANCFFHDFTAIYHLHAVYYSLLILFGIVFILNDFARNVWQGKVNALILNILFLAVLSLGMLFAASKIMIALLFAYFLYYLTFKLSNKRLKAVSLFALVLLVAIIGLTQSLRSRFIEGLDIQKSSYTIEGRQFSYDQKQDISDLELRLLLGNVAWTHMVDDGKIWLGYGVGDQQDYFDYHLMRYNLAPHWYYGHNVHNQYLDIWLNLGVFGLIYFLFMMSYFFYIAIKNRNELWVTTLIIFSIAFIFEVYLSRNKGIVVFTLFNIYFLMQSKYNNKNPKGIEYLVEKI